MWLIHARDERLVQFVYEHEKRPDYAILSHRWDGEHPEVSFQDMKDRATASSMPNYQKIWQTCQRALSDGLEYVWIDTCCINKDSSAELSEAINSMFRWYQGAKVCYAFLVDVRFQHDAEQLAEAITQSEWFERGWTLQELIAPRHILFVDRDWTELGTKSSLVEVISSKTGIDQRILKGEVPLASVAVGQRMSWAAHRKTTRVEDTAYCLMGIFDVNMPMLYGEGQKAFLRLQEEIIKTTDDQSIFAWPISDDSVLLDTNPAPIPSKAFRRVHGLLAASPAAFKSCRKLKRLIGRKGASTYAMTNRGLSIRVMARLIAVETYLVDLQCDNDALESSGGKEWYSRVGIFITRLDEDDQFARTTAKDGMSLLRYARDATPTWLPEHATGELNINVRHKSSNLHDGRNTTEGEIRKQPEDGRIRRQPVDGYRFYYDDSLLEEKAAGERPRIFTCMTNQKDYTFRIANLSMGETSTPFPHGETFTIKQKYEKSWLRTIALTFDLECNPIVFITSSAAENEVAEDMLGYYRSLKDQEMPWSEPMDNKRIFGATSLGRGTWALRGDRLRGLTSLLQVSDDTPIPLITLRRELVNGSEYYGMIVWALHLTRESNHPV